MESTFGRKEKTIKNKMRKITSMMAATVTGRGRQEVDSMKIKRKETRVTIAAETRAVPEQSEIKRVHQRKWEGEAEKKEDKK